MAMVIGTMLLFWWFIHCANNFSILSISVDLVEKAIVPAKVLARIFSALALMVHKVLSLSFMALAIIDVPSPLS